MAALDRKAAAMAAVPNKGRQGSPYSSELISGASLFAGTSLMLSGPLSILQGVTAITHDTVFSSPRYDYRFDLSAWGGIHLVVGVALVVIGVGVLLDKSWARAAGIPVAGISLVTQFMFVPYYPVWSIIVMTLDLLIIWALSRSFHPGTSGGR
ncbi:hypothetical protein GCM10010211_85290 [Streptomyces albospinus]|uniref:DUF7144 domain-containing protein n=1 Tax=Streptomyces albospinus TaxID=285515 RepID=A0ABQ2VPU4_9ACTN|nr:hypothetical protein [Streptomyces albospinus]GGV05167.1 hypothetical protein GCM10010211_85290 [Streptomyces albospinus]